MTGLTEREDFKLDLKGERDKTRLASDEPGGVMPVSGVKLIAQVKCIQTSAHCMGKKPEEKPEATVQQGNCESLHQGNITHMTEVMIKLSAYG